MKTYMLALAAAAAMTAGSAEAAVNVNVTKTATQSWNTAGGLLTAQRFDSSLGTLISVNVDYRMESIINATINNSLPWAVQRSDELTATGTLGIFFGSTLVSNTASCTASANIPGDTKRTLTCSSGNSVSAMITDKNILAALTGTSPTSLAIGTTYGSFGGSTTSTIKLNYSYIAAPAVAAVPEPATWAMMAGGFAMVGAAARRRRRTLVAA